MTADALIVGGGLAGAALAARLARAGREIVLLERETGPHDKVCGEFLSREATLYLRALGLDPSALGGVRIDRLRLDAGGRMASIDLPFTGWSLSRRVLDAALLDRARDCGATVHMGARVKALDRNGLWSARLQDGRTVSARSAFLATGKHDLKGWPRGAGLQGDLIGLKLYWRLAPEQDRALSGHVELTLFPGGYAGLQPVEGGRANLCLLVRRRTFAAFGHRWDELLAGIRAGAPLLDRRLGGAEPCLDRPLAIAGIPYGHVATAGDGLWRLGDQAAVIPSFSGDGMSIALHSAAVAAETWLAGEAQPRSAQPQYQARFARDIGATVRLATLLSLVATTGPGRASIGRCAAYAPGLMAAVARATRVPQAALSRMGLGPAA